MKTTEQKLQDAKKFKRELAEKIEKKLGSFEARKYDVDEVAKVLGITEAQVKRIEMMALRKLKSPKFGGKKLQKYIR